MAAREFKHGRQSLEDDPHSGKPVTVATSEIVTKVYDMVRQVTERYIASAVKISPERFHSILNLMEDLDIKQCKMIRISLILI